MPAETTNQKARATRWITGIAGLAAAVYLVPLFHVVSLKGAQERAAAALFSAGDYVESFWDGPLREATLDAVDASKLLAGFDEDFEATAERFGHRLGLSGHSSYLVSGEGQIVAVDATAVSIALQDGGPTNIIIELGPVFGNAIRDGSGLLNVSDFENAQDFNALSAELNMRVEEQVLPALAAGADIGATLRFVGGVEVSDSAGPPATLNIVPVVIEFP